MISSCLVSSPIRPYLYPGNGNRGGVGGGIFGIPPPGRKFFENTPPLEILGKFFEKPGKTEKIR